MKHDRLLIMFSQLLVQINHCISILVYKWAREKGLIQGHSAGPHVSEKYYVIVKNQYLINICILCVSKLGQPKL